MFTSVKVEGDPQSFINEMVEIFEIMHALEVKGVEYASYHLKDVGYQRYKEC